MEEGSGPTACEKTSTDTCYCTDPEAFLAMAAKSRMVDRKECIVVEQTTFPTGVEGSIGLGLGLSIALLYCMFR